MKKRGDFIPGVITTLFGIVTTTLTLTGEKMDLFIKKVPGQGFFPLICSVLLIVFGIALLFRAFKQTDVSYFNITPEVKENIKTVVLFLLGLIVLMIVWKLTNMFIPCVLVFCLYTNILLKRSPVFTIVFSVVMTGFIYLLFTQAFSVTFRV